MDALDQAPMTNAVDGSKSIPMLLPSSSTAVGFAFALFDLISFVFTEQISFSLSAAAFLEEHSPDGLLGGDRVEHGCRLL